MTWGKALFLSGISITSLFSLSAPAAFAISDDRPTTACIVEAEPVSTAPDVSQPSDSSANGSTPPPAPAPDASPPFNNAIENNAIENNAIENNAVEGNRFAPVPFGGQTPTLIPAIPANGSEPSSPPAETPETAPPANSLENTSPSPPPGNSPTPSNRTTPPSPSIRVNQIEVVGSTIFGADQLNPIVQPLRGRTVSLQDLRKAADQITELYVREGYITSFAELDNNSLRSGNIRIQVIEGGIAEIRIRGLRRLNPHYVCSRLRLATRAPVNANRLEEKLRLLKIDPLFNSVEATLQRTDNPEGDQTGNRLGQSTLNVQVVEADPIDFQVGFDNNLPSTIAPQEASFGIRHRDFTGLGDELAFSYTVGVNITDFPRAALNLYDLTYRVPLNPQEGALQIRGIYSDSAVTAEDFDQFGFRGTTTYLDIAYRQPIIRSLREELALTLGFTALTSQTFIFDSFPNPFEEGPNDNGFSRTRVVRFGQDYVRRDSQGAWGIQSQFNFGLDILEATQNTGSIPDGQFFSWQAQVARFQELGNGYRLIIRSGWQLTPDPLLSIQQFYLGGAASLRGYPPNSRRGDNGLYFGVEGRIPVFRDRRGIPTFQIAPFAELGYVWNDPANPNPIPDPHFLSDVGLSLIYQPFDTLSLQVDLALPLTNLEGRQDQPQDHGIYFSVNYNF